MRAETLLEALGLVDGELVLQAREAERPRRTSRRWMIGGLAACLALAVLIPAVVFLNGGLPWREVGSETFSGGDSSVNLGPELRDYRIYYVDGSALSSISVRLTAVPQERFNAWKDVNHIGDEVEFIEENTRDDRYQLTVSDSLRAYYDEENGNELLLQSLGRTMTEPEEETYIGFELYLEGHAVYPDDYPEFVDEYDEQGRLIYSRRPWSDWSIEIAEYDYEQGICKTSYYHAEGELEPGVTTEPEYTLEYVEEVSIDETGAPVGWYTRHTYHNDGSLNSISEYDEHHTQRLYTGYYADGSIRALVECNERGDATKMLYYREDGGLEEHREVEYDGEGRDCKHIYYDAEGELSYYELYFFDENGNWAGEEYYNCCDQLIYSIQCTYDEKGRRLTEAVYRDDGSLEKLTEYKYGSGIFYSSYSVYYYDGEGNLVNEWHGGANDGIIAGVTGEEG